MDDQVFLSYARIDARQARKLYSRLNGEPGIRVWFDKEDLLPGLRWRPAIRKAIRESRYFIGLLSGNTADRRGFQNTELRAALQILDEFPDQHVFLIPTRLEDCEPPIEDLRELNYADLFPDWEAGYQTLRRSLGIERIAPA